MAGQTINVSILADTKKFSTAMRNLSQKSGLSRLGSMAKTAAKGLAVATAAVTALGVGLFRAGETAGTSNARISQIFESIGVLGDGAGAAAERVQKLSDSMARSTGVNQNVIKEGAAILGTFSAIAESADEVGGVFDRTLGAATDLSAAGFGSVQSASTMLGKALQDPTRGLTSLTRVGVAFSEQQRDQIKAMQEAGDMAGAQALILEAVESQVGGTAEATANASDQIKVAFSQIAERLGLALMPAFTMFTDFVLDRVVPAVENTLVPAISRLSSWLQDTLAPALRDAAAWFGDNVAPAVQQLAGEIRDRVVPALQEAGEWITGTLIPALQDMWQWVRDNKDVLLIIASAVAGFVAALKTLSYIRTVTVAIQAAAVAFKALGTAMLANPIGLVVAAIAALVAGLVYFFTQTETGQEIWDRVWTFIKDTAATVSEWFTNTALPALQAAWDGIVAAADAAAAWYSEHVAPIFTAAGELIAEVASRLAEAWDVAWGKVQEVWGVIGEPVMAAIDEAVTTVQGVWETAWGAIVTALEAAWTTIRGTVETALANLESVIRIFTSALQGDWGTVWTEIGNITSRTWEQIKTNVDTAINAVKTIIGDILTSIKDRWSEAWEALKTKASEAWDDMKATIERKGGELLDWFRSLPGRIVSALGDLGSTLSGAGRELIDGFLGAIGEGFDRVRTKLGELTSMLPSWKGPPSKDKTILKGAGSLVIQGFIDGLESQYGHVKRSLAGLATDVSATQFDPVTVLELPTSNRQRATHDEDGHDSPRPMVARLAREDIDLLARTVVSMAQGVSSRTVDSAFLALGRGV